MRISERAYIAGIVDGEGYIGIVKSPPRKKGHSSYYRATVSISMTNVSAITQIRKRFGGFIYHYPRNTRSHKHKIPYTYIIADKKAERFIRSIYYYLRVKKKVAKVVLAFINFRRRNINKRTTVGTRHYNTDKTLQGYEKLYRVARKLNCKGIQ